MIFQWDDDNTDHIAEHGVVREEAEFVVEHATPPFPRLAGDGKSLVWGRTNDGWYLQVGFVVLSDERVEFHGCAANRFTIFRKAPACCMSFTQCR